MASILTEEEAARRLAGEAAQATADEAAVRIGRVETLEYQLFGMVVVVLVLEGLFVVNPAVLKIQAIMGDMPAVAQRVDALRREARAEQQRATGICLGGVARPSRAVAENPGIQRPTQVAMHAVLDDQGRDYLDRIQNAAGRCRR